MPRKYNFAQCLYNPQMDTFVTKITKAIPEFKQFKKQNADHKRIFQWVVYTYDRQSPLVLDIPEFMVRKGEAASLAGYDTDEEGKFQEEVENFILGKNDEVNKLIVAYVSRFADPHYIMLVASWNLLLDGTRKLLSGRQNKDTYNVIKTITADIEDITRTVFSTDHENEAIELRKALYSRVEQDRLKLNQESIVKYIDENGELPKGFNPYGDEYVVEKLKFIGDGEGAEA